MKLWQSSVNDSDPIQRAVESFTVGDDWLIDRRLTPWDCAGSMAHAMMLHSIGVLSAADLAAARQGLGEILALAREGKFEISLADEDCHTAIENYLSTHHGEVGKKIHTARSRNDQSLTALKLFLKDATLRTQLHTLTLADALLAFARKHPVPFPGYTHMQKGMPSTVQLWAASFAESLLDTTRLLTACVDFVDASPLGSAAGYGVTIPINRELTAELLGFARVHRNVITTQNGRGKNEAVVLSALATLMAELSKLGADLLFFSQRELGYLTLPERFCTGSSIMPQKRNPDVLELLRAKAKVVGSLHAQVLSIITDLPSGYNRDFQLTKAPAFQALDITEASLTILSALVPELRVDSSKCQAALEPELFAADIANELVVTGKSFRDAYREVKSSLGSLAVDDPRQFIDRKIHTGAPGNPGLDHVQEELAKHRSETAQRLATFEGTLGRLFHPAVSS
jgi:argininosuccinate lyase